MKKVKIISITGTKGKTTLTLLLDAVLRKTGKKVLCVSSEGIFKNGKLGKNNEYFLKKYGTSANVVALNEIKEKESEKYDYLLVENSYSSLKNIRNSFIWRKIDIGVLTNVYSDHIDGKKVKNRKDLLLKKIGILGNIKKKGVALIFSGDRKKSLSAEAVRILGSQRPDIMIAKYDGKFGTERPEYFLRGKYVFKKSRKLVSYSDLDMPFKNLHRPTDSNAVALIALMDLLKINPEILYSLRQSEYIIPGRLNFFYFRGRIIILDYAHEEESLKASAGLLRKKFKNKKIKAVVRLSYHRNRKTIIKLTKKMASLFDSFIIYDKAMSRPGLKKVFLKKYGMKAGEVADIMEEVIKSRGSDAVKIYGEFDAIRYGVENLRKNEVLYVMCDQVYDDVRLVKNYRKRSEKS